MAIDVNQPGGTASGEQDSDAQAKVADAAGQVQDAAQEAAEQVQQKAAQASGQAQARLRAEIEQRSAQASEQISQQASDLRSVSESLRKEGKDGPADAADRLAGYAEKVGGYLHEKDSDTLLADAEQFGRDRPWAAVAGGLAVGFAASRFLKASSAQRSQNRNDTASGQPEPSTPLGLGYANTSGFEQPPVSADAETRAADGTGSLTGSTVS